MQVKICGIRTEEAALAVEKGGAAFVGFVFFKGSRRVVTPEEAQRLVPLLPHVKKVGLFVEPTDEVLETTLSTCPLDLIQLHGTESPRRVATIRSQTGCQVIKSIPVSSRKDLAIISSYEEVADYLLFDKKLGGIPTGGMGEPFDWALLSGLKLKKPWLLAGGINASNLEKAVHMTGAQLVDLSSGVEDAMGKKDPKKIENFLRQAEKL